MVRGFRKWSIAAASLVASVLLAWTDHMTMAFAACIGAICGAYSMANAYNYRAYTRAGGTTEDGVSVGPGEQP
jgi:predicted metal-binding membrane protein